MILYGVVVWRSWRPASVIGIGFPGDESVDDAGEALRHVACLQ